MATLLWTILITLNGIVCNAQNCVFKDSGSSGQELDLRALAHTLLQKNDELTPPNTYQYTPCRNGLECGTDTAMALKLDSQNDSSCIVMANWDSTQTLPYFDDLLERWTFNYTTGNACGDNGDPYEFFVYLDCDEDIGDYRIVSAGLYIHIVIKCLCAFESTENVGDCQSEMYVDTQWACPGEIYTTEAPIDNSLSEGSVFIIVIFVGFIIYFVVGWTVNACRNRRDHGCYDVMANIPHFVFWTKLPLLVVAGCSFTGDFLSALCCENSASIADKSDRLVSKQDNQDINPFAN